MTQSVIVYVEGASDKLAMEALLDRLIQRKSAEGVSIRFIEAPPGDKKQVLLQKVPLRAVNIIRHDPHAVVAIVPDLYPKNRGFAHETYAELRKGILSNFEQALIEKGFTDDERLRERFAVFCFKHDLEALILAAEEALALRLGIDALAVTWRLPVEDQNHDKPPKWVVEELFKQHGQRYIETTDAPLILGLCDYQDIADACPQCFAPFVRFLESL